jgi:hypothetical protein
VFFLPKLICFYADKLTGIKKTIFMNSYAKTEQPTRMKLFLRLVFIVIIIFSFNRISAQDVNLAIIENVPEEIGWEIIHQSFKEDNIKLNPYNVQTNTAVSEFFEYTSLLIEYRTKYQVTFIDGKIEIKFIENQYLSTEGWANNTLRVSKKIKKKYLYPIADRIRTLAKGGNLFVAENTVNNKSASEIEKPQEIIHGEYEHFAFVKTENPRMQLLAFHEDGSMIGFRLDDNNEMVVSLAFRKNIDAPDFVLLFTEDGDIKGGGFGDYTYVFQKMENNQYMSFTYDKSKKLIEEKIIELPPLPIDYIIDPNENKSGPNSCIAIDPESVKELDYWLEVVNRSLDVVSCAIAIPTGLGAIGPCGSLLLGEILRELPKEHIYYNEILIAKMVFDRINFSPPKLLLEKIAFITANMETITDLYDVSVVERIRGRLNSEPEPFIKTDKTTYATIEGMAVITVDYSDFVTARYKKISIYRIEADKAFLFDEIAVSNTEGDVTFSTPFSGNYEARIYYNSDSIKATSFSVTANSTSTSKYSKYVCIDFLFSGYINKECKYNNQEEPNTLVNSFRINTVSCEDSRISPYGLQKQLEIVWYNNTFYATTVSKFGVSTVSYFFEGRISNDGNTLQFLNVKSVGITDGYDNTSLTKETLEITMKNIPFDKNQDEFYISNLTECIEQLSYLKTYVFYEDQEQNYTHRNVNKDGKKMAHDDAFTFSLKFFKIK